MRAVGAGDEVVAAGIDGLLQSAGDDPQVSDPGFDVGELAAGPCNQTRVGAVPVSVSGGVDQLGDVFRGETEPLGALITFNRVTVSGGKSLCPPGVRCGWVSSPRRS